MNKITIIGNLGRDPEMHHSNSGQAMTRFSVATNLAIPPRPANSAKRSSGPTAPPPARPPRSVTTT
ncbi:hypothetical protein GBAR_LOCUS25832 [Geodia barretti]|uniref:Single-stranded DNA-binding protein n=1 Tax=Geodia barretti TaxID=519541 RepID=A0AA35TE90_GEOBA|nr:hypothetical protein GBAR_LOCUS25832 [Geodia barretti]